MMEFVAGAIGVLEFVALLAIGGLIVTLVVLYVLDVNQRQQTIRRNYPVVGRFRYWFEHLGEFFRQYFFAMDREELPFNRADRSWVYRAAKNVDNTQAFGSTYPLHHPGSIVFANAPYPVLEQNSQPITEIEFGPYSEKPYRTSSIFNVSAMSFGAISKPAVTALAHGAKQAGCWLNTGEGGLSPYHLSSGADVVFQIGTAKYGVRDETGALSDAKLEAIAAHECVRMFEIKLSQGAKPGKGGILPALKVTEEIAAIRGIPVGQASLSPNGHEDIQSVDDLLDMIERVRRVTGKPVGFKAVLSSAPWLEELCEAILRRGKESAPDFITVDSGDGGTGAAPTSLMDYMGLTIKESLPLLVDTLLRYGLRSRVRVICSGKLVTPSKVAWALCLGADAITSARGFMFALGCIQSLKCNQNNCPTGIATHDPHLQQGLDPTNKMHRVYQYVENMKKEVEIIAHSCGVAEPRLLRRKHVRQVQADGYSRSFDDLFPALESLDEVNVEVVKVLHLNESQSELK
jgi:glutamate synthase domain-containing protein 2